MTKRWIVDIKPEFKRQIQDVFGENYFPRRIYYKRDARDMVGAINSKWPGASFFHKE